jgi:glycerophosphoryl diester phosphodiesterase
MKRDLAWIRSRPIAHRGYHDAAAGRIENTLSAVRAAVERGFAIEVDLLNAKDEVPVVFHDDTLDRLTFETGRVDRFTAAELKEIPFRGTTDRIPTLADLLDAVAGRVGLVLELKSEFPRQADDRLAARVAEVLAGYAGPVVLKSFDPEVVIACHRFMPDIPAGIVADRTDDPDWRRLFGPIERFALRHLLHGFRSRPNFVSYCVGDLPAPGPWVARRLLGLPVMSWTVRTPEQRAHALKWADQIVFEGFDPDRT